MASQQANQPPAAVHIVNDGESDGLFQQANQPPVAAQIVNDGECDDLLSKQCLMIVELNNTYFNGGMPRLLRHFHDFCISDEFIDHCVSLGFTLPSFEKSSYLDGSWAGYRKFASCLDKELAPMLETASITSSTERSVNCGTSRRIGLVFHGTKRQNILSILHNGLCLRRRRGQAFGPGEYFATRPDTAVSYCIGGLQMVVFIVILPEKREGSTMPDDIVVVNNNQHHLAIGTLQFRGVDRTVLAASQVQRQRILLLSKEVIGKKRAKQEAETKALIMKQLIANKVDLASEIYMKKSSLLGNLSKREIAWYVNAKLDEDVVETYFPFLPGSIEHCKLPEVNIESVDAAEEKEREAARKLEQARQEYSTYEKGLKE